MSILNRYVLKKFVRPFFSSFAILCILITVSQIFEQLDRFLGKDVNFHHIIGYLLSSLPFQALQMLPVACLLGTLFVVGDLARNKEYVAGLASGLAPEKFLGGILIAGLLISMVATVANETFVPKATRYSREVYREKIRRLGSWRQVLFGDVYVVGQQGRLWRANLINQDTGIATRILVDTFSDGLLGTQLDAMEAHWTPETGWTFYKVVERQFQKDGYNIVSSQYFEQKKYDFPEKPTDLVTQEPQPEEMNYKKLQRHIKRLTQLGIETRRLKVELMVKMAFPFSCFIVTFLGIPLAMTGKGNKAIGVAAGGALTLVYLGCMQMGKALGLRLIPPFLGAWLGNFIFIAVAAYLWVRMRRTA